MTIQHYAEAKETARLNAITIEQDRQRERKRQQAFRDVKATAEQFRKLPIESQHFYQNSDGERIGISSLPISLC